ncbi:hypothetical protein HY495_03850 [Candidatus Woesearchaeota archaeon]|nr:hypothetical protein [Candidatus Woesearchaeota archaeon]
MEIKDVKPNQGNIDLVAEVKTKEAARTFEKFGKKGKVCNATLKDQSGEITLTLWNDDVDTVNVGDKVHLQNGWCSEYKGAKQLSTGKFGKIEVMGGTAAGTVSTAALSPKTAAKTVFTNDPGMLAGKMAGGDEDDDGDDGDGDEEEPEEEFID